MELNTLAGRSYNDITQVYMLFFYLKFVKHWFIFDLFLAYLQM